MQTFYVINCGSTSITSSAYLLLLESTPVSVSKVQFFYYDPAASVQVVKLAIGAAGSEIDMIASAGSGTVNEAIPIFIPSGSRLSVQAITGTVSTGFLILSLLNV